MGKLNQPHALVVMTNGDVYYLTALNEKELQQRIAMNEKFYVAIDIKSEKTVTIVTAHVSSIVEGSHHAER